MRVLSKEAEQTILDAIEDVCEYVGSGDSPTAAVVKVANEQQLSPNFIKLVCTGYNTGATAYQREKSASTLELMSSFPLADYDQAISEIFPKQIASPSAVKTATVVSAEYSRGPRPNTQRARQERQKTAEFNLGTILGPRTEKNVTPAGESKDRMKHAFCQVADLDREVKRRRAKYASAQDALLTTLGELGEYMRRTRDISLNDLAFATETRFGKAASAIMDYVHYRNGGREKRAATVPTTARRVYWDQQPYTLVSAAIDAAAEVKRAEADYTQYQRMAEQRAGTLLDPFVGASEPQPVSILTQEVQKTAETKTSGMASIFPAIVGSSIVRSAGGYPPKSPAEMTDAMADKLNDPVHEQELRKIQAQAMLQDLVTNDEVISGYDPEEVMDAYNEISALSPRSATQAAVVRPLLRKRLTQGAMEPFEAAELANIEKTIAMSQAKRPSQNAFEEQ